MPSTYTPIATQTLGSNAASVTFSSISGSYTDLILVTNIITSTASEYITVQLNSDTGTNYSRTALSGSGTAASSYRASNENQAYIANQTYGTNSLKFNSITHFMNYSNTTTNKTFITRANQADLGVDAVVNLWRNTAAISTIKINSNFATGSTFTLYGVKSA